jgi:hypothetical protein
MDQFYIVKVSLFGSVLFYRSQVNFTFLKGPSMTFAARFTSIPLRIQKKRT